MTDNSPHGGCEGSRRRVPTASSAYMHFSCRCRVFQWILRLKNWNASSCKCMCSCVHVNVNACVCARVRMPACRRRCHRVGGRGTCGTDPSRSPACGHICAHACTHTQVRVHIHMCLCTCAHTCVRLHAWRAHTRGTALDGVGRWLRTSMLSASACAIDMRLRPQSANAIDRSDL